MRKHRESGFTMVEVLAVMGVLGVVLTTLGATLSRTIPVWRVRQAAVEVASSLRAARARAIIDRTEVTVPFDPGRNRYIVLRGAGAESTVAYTPTRSLAKLPDGVRFVDPGGTLSVTLDPPGSEAKTARFSRQGLLRSDNSPGYVYVGNAGRRIYWRVAVNAVGVIRVERWTGKEWV